MRTHKLLLNKLLIELKKRVQSLRATDTPHLTSIPNLTVIAKPVFPYRPVISTSDIYALDEGHAWYPRRVAGGISYLHKDDGYIHREFNEYGIAYYRTPLSESEVEQAIEYGQFIFPIKFLIKDSQKFYKKCEYLGNIEVTAQLQQVFEKKTI